MTENSSNSSKTNPDVFTIMVEDPNGVFAGHSIGDNYKVIQEKLGCKLVAIGCGNMMYMSEHEYKQLLRLAESADLNCVEDSVIELVEFIQNLPRI